MLQKLVELILSHIITKTTMSSTQTVWGATLPQLDKESIQELEENDKVDVQTVQIDGMVCVSSSQR